MSDLGTHPSCPGRSVQMMPLTHAESRIYFTQKMHPGSSMWNLPYSLRLASAEPDLVEAAVRFVVETTPGLRCRFTEVKEQPTKWRADGEAPPVERLDFSAEGEKAYLDWAADQAGRPLPMLDAVPYRLAVADVGDGVVFVFFLIHHILADGGSVALLQRKVVDAFEALRQGKQAAAPSAPDPGLALSAEQAYLSSADVEQDRAYWNHLFEIIPDPLDIAGHPGSGSLALGELTYRFSTDTTSSLLGYCAEYRVSPFRVVLAAMAIVLARTLQRDDLALGTATANRHPAELNDAVGMFVSTLALRLRVEPTATFAQVVTQASDAVRQAKAHERYPYDLLTSDLRQRTGEAPDLIACTLVEVVHQPLPGYAETIQHCHGESLIGLSCYISYPRPPNGEGLLAQAALESRVELFSTFQKALLAPWRVEQLLRHTENIVRRGMHDPGARVAELELLSRAERARILDQFNDSAADWEVETTVQAAIEAVVRKQPGRTAVVYRGRKLSYGELDARANALARGLREAGARPGTVVGLLADRSLEIVIAQLAILKSGAAFMPIDAEYPEERIRFMLGDIRAPLIVTQTRFLEEREFGAAKVIDIDRPEAFAADPRPLDGGSGPRDLCVAIYTSGSTGQPKGALLEHRSIVNIVRATLRDCRITPEDRVAKHASFSFDASLLEVFLALMGGAELHVIPEEIRLSLSHLNEYFEEYGVTWAFLTTQLGEQFMEFIDNGSLRNLFVGGEKLRTFVPRHYRLTNIYGPTECAIYATQQPVERAEENIPIGRVVPNDRIYILDRQNQPQPCGAAGELCIGGVGVGRGYHDRADLNHSRFVEDPFRPGERMYRTGDLARWEPDGRILHLGRIDRQVKLRGFRIELGEIENAILALDGIHEAAVADLIDHSGHLTLCGYFSGPGVSVEKVRAELARRLPPFMAPTHLMRLESLPLNPSGKIDRKRLPPPEGETDGSLSADVAPEGDLEVALAAAWGRVLDLKRVSALTDFFASGGDSLRAVTLQLSLSRSLHREVDLSAIFEHPTPRAMASFLSSEADAEQRIASAPVADGYPATVSQQQLYLLSRLPEIGLTYNMPMCLRLDGELDRARLSTALRTLLNRHESLRTAFDVVSGRFVQRVLSDLNLNLELVETGSDDLDTVIGDFVRPFDLARPPLMRARLVTRSTTLAWLLLDFHHIAFDGVSAAVFFSELSQLYGGRELATPALQQKDFAVWEAGRADAMRAAHESFWLELFGDPPTAEWPADRERPNRLGFAGDLLRHPLENETTRMLRVLAKRNGATLHQVFLAGLAVLAGRWTDSEDVCLGASMSGRDRAEIARTLGMFVRTLPTRIRPAADKTFVELLAEVRSQLLGIHEHGDYPISALYEKLGVNRGPGRHPLFDVNFVMRNTGMESDFGLGDLAARLSILPTQTAKFDLSFAAEESGNTLTLQVDFRTDLYERETVARMLGHLLRILTAAARQPDQRLGQIEILGPEERRTLLRVFNPAPTPNPSWRTVCAAIASQSAVQPDHPAVIAENGALTYAELDALANRAARAIQAAGAGPDHIVAVVADRSTWPVVGMLAALKAGAAYVGLDVHYPLERIAFILDDTQAPCILGATEQLDRMPGNAVHIALDGPLPADASDPGLARGGKDLAYVIFTSGSTGQPKGVLIEHDSMVNFLHWYAGHHQLAPESRCAAFAAFSFDVSVAQIFAPLVAGATLHVIAEDLRRSPVELNDYFLANGMTHAHFPTQFAEHFMRLCPRTSLKTLVVGGDQLKHYRIDAGYRLTNEYGPSETTMACLSNDVDRLMARPPVGAPIANTRIYIMDSRSHLCPLGVPGEICVAGAGVGRGYWRREALTAERFVADPLAPGERMFRTGDRGRWLREGVVDFIGRMDYQVKIRGYRVEPGEIEARIKESGAETSRILECVVAPIEDASGNKVLAAYFTADTPLDAAALRARLASSLPDYMVPAHIVQLPKMPLNPNGKIDRARLPRPELSAPGSAEPLKPRNPREECIAQAWRKVLGHDGFGLFDSFFSVGGDSLSALALLAELTESFQIGVADIFAHTSIAEQADRFAEAELSRAARLLRLKDLAAPCAPDPVYATEQTAYDEARARDAGLDTDTRAEPERVLLTGATGTLGIYLLRELLQATACRVVAIVRGQDRAAAWQRVAEHYQDRFDQELDTVSAGRLEVLPGDLARADLGLDPSVLTDLEQSIDAVLHAAALTSHYGDWELFERANVSSVRHLIDFARRGCGKHVHHVSTTSIGAGVVEGRDQILFTEFDVDKGQRSSNLYVRSKLQAERLLDQARHRGLAVTVYRAGNITCDSTTGAFQRNVDDNAFFQTLRAFVNLGAAPNRLDARNFTYVDQAARAIVIAMTRPGLTGQRLHIQNPRLLSLSRALSSRALGLRLEPLPFDDFIDFLADHAGCAGFEPYIENLLVHLGWQEWLTDRRQTITTIGLKRSAALLERCGFHWKTPEPRDLRLFVTHALADRLETLRRIASPYNVDDKALLALAKRIKPEHFAPEGLLQRERRPVSGVRFLVDGLAETYRHDDEGWIGTLRISGQGACIGEEAVPSDSLAVDSVQAIDDVFAFQILPAEMRSLILHHPRLGLMLLGVVSAKVNQAERLSVSL